MIIKIQPPSSKMESPLNYNERKADGPEGVRLEDVATPEGEDGHILVTRNVPEGSTLEEEFNRLADINRKTARGKQLEKPAFHMSVNPGKNDSPMSETQIVEFVDELMQKMGYSDSPYRIYKHTDISRVHYHVVSCRIGQDGKKINDSFENRKINRIAKELEEKYGYTLGLDDEQEEEVIEKETGNEETNSQSDTQTNSYKQTSEKEDRTRKRIPPFNPDEPLNQQFINFHNEAMTWEFSTPEQYAAILRCRFRCIAEEYNDGIHYMGMGNKGESVTAPVTQNELKIDSAEVIIQKCLNDDKKKRKSKKKRLERIAEAELKDCEDFKEYRKRLARKGIYMVLSYTQDGDVFGITWLDSVTKTAFKGSETSITVNWLKDLAEKNGWVLVRSRTHDNKNHIRKVNTEIERRKKEKLLRELTNDQDRRAEGETYSGDGLDNNPYNIKI